MHITASPPTSWSCAGQRNPLQSPVLPGPPCQPTTALLLLGIWDVGVGFLLVFTQAPEHVSLKGL